MEDGNGMGDGMLSSAIDIAVPGSSTFTAAPSVSGVPTQTAVAFTFDVAHDAGATQGLSESMKGGHKDESMNRKPVDE